MRVQSGRALAAGAGAPGASATLVGKFAFFYRRSSVSAKMRAAVVLAVGAVAVSAASVTVPFFRRSGPAPRKRRSLASVSVGDKDNDNLYYALVEIGTPPVSYGLQLDTGSVVSDFRVLDPSARS